MPGALSTRVATGFRRSVDSVGNPSRRFSMSVVSVCVALLLYGKIFVIGARYVRVSLIPRRSIASGVSSKTALRHCGYLVGHGSASVGSIPLPSGTPEG